MSWFEQEKNLTPPGEYDVTIFDVMLSTISSPPKLSIQYKDPKTNKRFFQNFRFDEKGKKWLTWQMGMLDVLNRAKELCENAESVDDVANAYLRALEEIKGSWATVEIKHREFEGRTYESCSVVARLMSAPLSEPDFRFDVNEQLPF